MRQNEIVIYQSSELPDFQSEVLVEDKTVCLIQSQMEELFSTTKQNNSLYISNILKHNELLPGTTVKEYLTVQKEGERSVKRKIAIYNLDFILSVGYRVKSQNSTQFKTWND